MKLTEAQERVLLELADGYVPSRVPQKCWAPLERMDLVVKRRKLSNVGMILAHYIKASRTKPGSNPRICYRCKKRIARFHKWVIDGSRIRHRHCGRPDSYV